MTDGIRCCRCEQVLAEEAFSPSQRKRGGACRPCRSSYMRTQRNPDLPCAGCGRLLYRSENSLPAGKARCRTCRQPELQTHGGKPSGSRWRKVQQQVWAEETNCGICGDPVDQSLPTHNRMARTVDHIIPIAHGGAMYERTNVRLAHRSCNSRAGQRITGTIEVVQLLRAAVWLGSRL